MGHGRIAFLVCLVGACTSRPAGWTEATHGTVAPNYSYVFDDTVVRRLDITVSSDVYKQITDDLEAKLSSISPSLDMQVEKPIYAPVNVTCEGITWHHVGMRYKGNASLASAYQKGSMKLPFRLDFSKFDDQFPDVVGQRFYGFRKLLFSNGYGDPSLIREKVGQDLFRAFGVPTARTTFVAVYIDYGKGSKYMGVYTLVEDPKDTLIRTQFSDSNGNLYKPQGTGADWTRFVADGFPIKAGERDTSDVEAAIAALHADRTDAVQWRRTLETTFDVQTFLRMLALNQTMVNWDSYGCMAHNYYLYGDPAQSRRLTWIPSDLHLSMRPVTRTGCYPTSVLLSELDDDWPLIRLLLDDATYIQNYRAYLAEALNTVYSETNLTARFTQAHALISPYVLGPQATEKSPYTLLDNATAFRASLPEDGVTATDASLLPFAVTRRQAVAQALGL
jgi:hypothetical protein